MYCLMRTIRRIFVHCADTPPSMDIGAAEIRRWHIEERKWRDIGYHAVIRRDGTVEAGRDLDGDGDVDEEIGAHAAGHNADSLAVCMVGGRGRDGKAECNFTLAQWRALDSVLAGWLEKYPGATVLGHNDVESGKQCPGFAARYLMG